MSMLLDPVNWLVDEVYQMRGKGLKSLFDFVKFIIDDMPYECRLNDCVDICHKHWGLGLVMKFF
mgnify:FL=1